MTFQVFQGARAIFAQLFASAPVQMFSTSQWDVRVQSPRLSDMWDCMGCEFFMGLHRESVKSRIHLTLRHNAVGFPTENRIRTEAVKSSA